MADFKLNNAGECLGFLCLFVACNDGELSESEVGKCLQVMDGMMKAFEIDTDGDGHTTNEDVVLSFQNVWKGMADMTWEQKAGWFLGICKNYFADWSDQNKSMIVSSLVKIAAADGVYQQIEKDNVNLVADVFGVERPF